MKNQNRRNQAGNKEARGRAYALGGGEANQDSNVVTGTFLLNNRYASILFDSGADRSFVSTTFSSLIDIFPIALDIKYAVELADGNIIRADTIIWGSTLYLLNHPFNIDFVTPPKYVAAERSIPVIPEKYMLENVNIKLVLQHDECIEDMLRRKKLDVPS
ncbi:reverse transcriptase domain-containing protein [Tanacetum coccineum]|uniref:Reverse transcriptase domain-containing protein n=1 Tax=Tanacetum coccineum TaxID=301880 RepID=A0ABQ5IVL9_9ASTR